MTSETTLNAYDEAVLRIVGATNTMPNGMTYLVGHDEWTIRYNIGTKARIADVRQSIMRLLSDGFIREAGTRYSRNKLVTVFIPTGKGA